MSREIKFRGYHEQADDMVFFGLGGDNMRAWSESENESYSFWLSHGHPVMQFTGLKDRNGVDIYESDIMWSGELDQQPYVVTWSERSASWQDGEGEALVEFSRYDDVIGNTHQNRDLLEVKS